MKKSRSVDKEAVDSLALMFPGVHRNELTNFLEENGFDKAVELLSQIYPQDNNSDEQNSNDKISNEQKSNGDDIEYDYDEFDDSIQALSDSIPIDDKNKMLKDIQKEFPDFDDDICMVFLEDSMFDIQKAKQEAAITKQQMEEIYHQNNLNKLRKDYPNLSEVVLSNILEAANEDYSMACSIINESMNEPTNVKTDKKAKKKQIISEMGPVSCIQTKKKAKKFKNKPNMLMKSTEKQFACEFSEVNEKMKYEAQIVKLTEMFADNSKNLSRTDFEEALNLTNCDINRAASIISQKIESYQLNENANKGSNDNNSAQRPIKSKKVKKLVQMFPQSSSSELEDVLYLSNGNLNVASEIMLNRNNGSPQPEEELLDSLLKSAPSQEQNDDDDDDDNLNDDADDTAPIIVNPKHIYSSTSKIVVNKTNRNHARPSQHGKTETKEIDLHGLTAAEAQVAVMQALDDAKYKNIGTISFITGRGQHTKGNVSVLRPLVLSFCKDHGYRAHVGSNRGVVVCHLV